MIGFHGGTIFFANSIHKIWKLQEAKRIAAAVQVGLLKMASLIHFVRVLRFFNLGMDLTQPTTTCR
jgi:hypothetical protein